MIGLYCVERCCDNENDSNENAGLTIPENEARVRCRSRRSYFYHPEQRDLAREKPGGGGSQFLRMVCA